MSAAATEAAARINRGKRHRGAATIRSKPGGELNSFSNSATASKGAAEEAPAAAAAVGIEEVAEVSEASAVAAVVVPVAAASAASAEAGAVAIQADVEDDRQW